MNADLQRVYGVCLADMYEGRIGVLDVADFAVHLPRGGAVAEWFGGWGAISAEDEAMRRVEYLMQVQIVQASGRKRKVPEPKPPGSILEGELRKKREARGRREKAAAMQKMSKMYGG